MTAQGSGPMYSELVEAVHRMLAVNERLRAEAAALQAEARGLLAEEARPDTEAEVTRSGAN